MFITKYTQTFGVTTHNSYEDSYFSSKDREQSRKLLVITEAFVINDEIIAQQSTSITIT